MSCYVQMVLHSRICPRNSLPSLCVGLRDYLNEVVKSIEPGPTLYKSTCTQRRGVYWFCSGKLSVYEWLLSLQDFTTGVGSDSQLLAVGSWQLDHRIAGCCVPTWACAIGVPTPCLLRTGVEGPTSKFAKLVVKTPNAVGIAWHPCCCATTKVDLMVCWRKGVRKFHGKSGLEESHRIPFYNVCLYNCVNMFTYTCLKDDKRNLLIYLIHVDTQYTLAMVKRTKLLERNTVTVCLAFMRVKPGNIFLDKPVWECLKMGPPK